MSYVRTNHCRVKKRIQELEEKNEKLRKACQRAFDFVADEDNNKIVVKMPFSFGLHCDLAEALDIRDLKNLKD